eukprot:scaffold2691_cov417-Prasinococcus_capsulatus_cf.AAC.28
MRGSPPGTSQSDCRKSYFGLLFLATAMRQGGWPLEGRAGEHIGAGVALRGWGTAFAGTAPLGPFTHAACLVPLEAWAVGLHARACAKLAMHLANCRASPQRVGCGCRQSANDGDRVTVAEHDWSYQQQSLARSVRPGVLCF